MTRDLSGKTIVITGASSGIGLEASVELAKRGARIVMVARDAKRAEAAREEIAKRSGGEVELLLADMGSQKAVRSLASQILAKCPRIDVLVNNAGLVSAARQVTEDGIEQTFAVNHLGYFLLTHLLLDRITASAPARIVNVASIGHRRGTLEWDNLQYEKGGYQILSAYARSKLANVLFTRELARRLEGSRVTVNSMHPGAVATGIWSKAPWFARPFLALGKMIFMISPAKGAGPIIRLAADPDVEGRTGGYYERYKLVDPAPLARDPANATKLWELSERLVSAR